jgi:hypothetical protein
MHKEEQTHVELHVEVDDVEGVDVVQAVGDLREDLARLRLLQLPANSWWGFEFVGIVVDWWATG